jgi:hypothetical protein
MEHIVAQWQDDRIRHGRARRVLVRLVVCLAVAVPLWFAGVMTGLLPLSAGYIYEQWSNRPENLHGWSHWDQNWTLGTDVFYLRSGQTIYVDYDATVYEGAFTVRVYRITGTLGGGELLHATVADSASGRRTATVTEAGFYQFSYYAQGDRYERTGGHESFCWVAWGILP